MNISKLIWVLIVIIFSCGKENPEPVKSSEAKILTYSINGVAFKINQSTGTIDGKIAAGTDRTNLVAKFTISDKAKIKIGDKEQISGVTKNNFTNAVRYVVIAEDGTEKVYNVKIKSSDAQILTYSINGVAFKINQSTGTIEGKIAAGTDRTNLVAKFTISAKAKIKVGDKEQISGVTKNNFTNAVRYVVIAEDGTEKVYNVKIKSSDAQILTYSINGVAFKINQSTGTIDGKIAAGIDRTNLVAKFTISAKAKIKIGNKEQISGVTKNNFTNAVEYKLIAEDGTEKVYNVKVSYKYEALIKEFKFLKSKNMSNLYSDITGQIDDSKSQITAEIEGGGHKYIYS